MPIWSIFPPPTDGQAFLLIVSCNACWRHSTVLWLETYLLRLLCGYEFLVFFMYDDSHFLEMTLCYFFLRKCTRHATLLLWAIGTCIWLFVYSNHPWAVAVEAVLLTRFLWLLLKQVCHLCPSHTYLVKRYHSPCSCETVTFLTWFFIHLIYLLLSSFCRCLVKGSVVRLCQTIANCLHPRQAAQRGCNRGMASCKSENMRVTLVLIPQGLSIFNALCALQKNLWRKWNASVPA